MFNPKCTLKKIKKKTQKDFDTRRSWLISQSRLLVTQGIQNYLKLLWLGSKTPGELKMVRSDMKQTENGLFKALKTIVGNFALHCVW